MMRAESLCRAGRAVALVAFAAACSGSASSTASPSDGGIEPHPGTPSEAGADAAAPCSGAAGTFHDVPFESGGETRHYWLHVPASYRCTVATPLLVDFHGTGYGSATDTVEESWATQALTDASDADGYIVVRPRSRALADGTGNYLYQWDINAGDVPRNKAFATALVASLAARYTIDPARSYASGFSNGPGMAAQFLADEPSIFHGFGLVSGGMNEVPMRAQPFDADAPRIYDMVGFRDYMQVSKDALDGFLSAHAYPAALRFDREADTGHEIYGWHFREMFAWMDRGSRPAPGAVVSPWTAEATGTTESLVEMTIDPGGDLVAVGANGGIYRRGGGGGIWASVASLPGLAPISDVCFGADGHGYAVGHGHLATTVDGATWTERAPIPEFASNPQFGYTYATSVGCQGARVTVGGVWSSATSVDGGATWTAADTMGGAGASAFAIAIRPSPAGWLGAGYFWAARSSDGAAFTESTPDETTQWWNDATLDGANALLVGEAGSVAASASSGASFRTLTTTTTTEDLYAVALRGTRAIAVGQHGAVIVSSDGGATWAALPTGLDAYLGAVRFLDDHTVLAVGGGGHALRATLP